MSDFCINRSCLESLRSFLLNKAGIILFDHQVSHISEYIQNMIESNTYQSCEAYLNAIQNASEQSPEFEGLIAKVTVGESYFFRDTAQMTFLKGWLPTILAKKKQQNSSILRIWSAGCSCGQEIYSIAILLKEVLADELQQWHLRLLGTDINPNVLRSAIDGVYSEWSLRATERNIINNYFTKTNNHYLLDAAIRDCVNFTYHNLVNYDLAPNLNVFSGMDLIVCRNVFIYFAPRDIEGLGFIQEGNISYYQKKTTGVLLVKEKDSLEKSYATAAVSQVNTSETNLLEAVEDKIKQADWYAALLLIKRIEKRNEDVYNNKILLTYKTKALANLGNLHEALDACKKALELDKLNPELFLLKAFILMDLHDFAQAETVLRGAIFLDKDFIEAYYHLGILLLRQGQNDKGIKNLQVALSKAEKNRGQAAKYLSPGNDLDSFINVLKNEIKTYTPN